MVSNIALLNIDNYMYAENSYMLKCSYFGSPDYMIVET